MFLFLFCCLMIPISILSRLWEILNSGFIIQSCYPSPSILWNVYRRRVVITWPTEESPTSGLLVMVTGYSIDHDDRHLRLKYSMNQKDKTSSVAAHLQDCWSFSYYRIGKHDLGLPWIWSSYISSLFSWKLSAALHVQQHTLWVGGKGVQYWLIKCFSHSAVA